MNRIKILEDAILAVARHNDSCICTAIAFIQYRDIFRYRMTLFNFPEFLKYKPAGVSLWFSWFRRNEDGNASRVAIMLLVLDEICRAEKRD